MQKSRLRVGGRQLTEACSTDDNEREEELHSSHGENYGVHDPHGCRFTIERMLLLSVRRRYLEKQQEERGEDLMRCGERMEVWVMYY